MKPYATKIVLFILIFTLLQACDTVKRVPEGKSLLVKNEILRHEKPVKQEVITDLIAQKPNTSLLNIPFSLMLYNLARPNPDSVFQARFIDDEKRFEFYKKLLSEKQVYRMGESFWYKGKHNFLKNIGDAPVIVDENRTKRSELRLKSYYFNEGYFDVNVTSSTDSVGRKKAKVTYYVDAGTPYMIDSLSTAISSKDLDSLYHMNKAASFIKNGTQYRTQNFDEERNRLTNYFRNNGVYNFQQNFITFEIDTIDTDKKAHVEMAISDYTYRDGDTIVSKPFVVYKISEVNIYTDNPSSKNAFVMSDSITYNNFNLYSRDKLKYKPKAITDAIFIQKDGTFADFRTNLTTRYLSNLRVFNYPSIQYVEDKSKPGENALIANIYLSPRKKYSFGAALDVTHSNIQDFGISANTSLSIRNIFRGAETLELALRGNVGSSRQLSNPNDNFFNLSEYGADIRLNFPRALLPFKAAEKWIPKNMIPSTLLSAGFAKQQNIGLDKENLTGSFSYNWTPKRFQTARFDLLNVQFVRNLRVDNYFRVYRSSYNALNNLAQNYADDIPDEFFDSQGNLIIESGTNGFVQGVLDGDPLIPVAQDDFRTIRSIEERRKRLTENNLILASSFSFSKTTKTTLQDHDFYVFRTKVESAGNLLSLISNLSGLQKNSNNNYNLFDIEYSQYLKTEVEFIKHWELKRNQVLATRSFIGIAIPYGNSNSIPFSRSYFGGGSNDNRGWRPYSLGPGASSAQNDFNEANLKLSFNAEYRFKIFGNFKGAFFADAGNIWNVLDNETLEENTFDSLTSLRDIALGSGFGLRYDFSFFVVRLDTGFKTYNPANAMEKRWFNEYNFKNAVLNIGINYPF